MPSWTKLLADFCLTPLRAGEPVEAGRNSLRKVIVDAGGIPDSTPRSPLLVLVNDPDRATRTNEALAAVRSAAGSRPLHVLVATGSHRFPTAARKRHETALRQHADRIFWHTGHGRRHVRVGRVHLDHRLAAASDVVGIGSAEPHWFAGVTGVHKTLTIGVMAVRDIERNHELALSPRARPLVLAGNPVHEQHMRAVEAVCAKRAVLGIQHADKRWFAGTPEACVAASLPLVRALWSRSVEGPLDFLVATVEPPLDRTLYQADKGIKNSEHVVRDGGAIVLDADCRDGVGPSRFVELLRKAPDAASARALIKAKGYRLGDHKAVRLRSLQGRGVRLGLVAPTFPADVAAVVGIELLADRKSAAAWLREQVGGTARGALVADAAHTVVELA